MSLPTKSPDTPVERRTLSAAEIAKYLGQEHTAGSLAAGVAMFWPTIRDALLAYDKQTNGAKVEECAAQALPSPP